MSWIPNPKEIESLLKAIAPVRYQYFVKHVADSEEVWSSWRDGGWLLAGDDDNRVLVPVWPHSKYAELCADEMWSRAIPKPIGLDSWLKHWLPGIERDGRLVAVFQTPLGNGVCVEPKRLADDLEMELENYE